MTRSTERGAAGRFRRLSLIQVATLTAVVIIVGMGLALVVSPAIQATDHAQDIRAVNSDLVDVRDRLRVQQQLFFANQANGRHGLSPAQQTALTQAIDEVSVIASGNPDDPVVASSESTVIRNLGAIVALADDPAFARGPSDPAYQDLVERAVSLTAGVELAGAAWIGRLESLASAEEDRAGALQRRLRIGLGLLVGLALVVGIVLWLLLDRARRRVTEQLAEHGSRRGAMAGALQDGMIAVSPEGVSMEVNDALCEMTGYSREELLGRRMPFPFCPERECDRIMDALGEASRGAVELDVSFERKDGQPLLAIVSAAALSEQGGVLATIKDVTERLHTQERLRFGAVEGRALQRISAVAASDTEPEAVMAVVAEQAGSLLEVAAAGVVRFEPDGCGTLVGHWLRPGEGQSIPTPTTVSLRGASAVALVRRRGRPARVDDDGLAVDGRSRSLAKELGFTAAVAVPIRVGGLPWGALTAATRSPDGLHPEAAERLGRLADMVGLACAHADAFGRLDGRANADALTGMADQRGFQDRLAAAVHDALTDDHPLSLALFGVDDLAQVSDRHGFEAADAAIVEIAGRLNAGTGAGSVVARIGADEFAWVIPGEGTDAWQRAEAMRREIARDLPGQAGALIISAGVCELPEDGDPERLMQLARGALYWSRTNGRDITCLYSAELVIDLSAQERAERLDRSRALVALEALARAVDARDSTTLRHSERVAALAAALADELGWSDEDCARMREAGLLHDVGKIGIQDAVLFKPDLLTNAERAEVEEHSALGAEIVTDALMARQVAWIRGHHERVDGTGYPDRLVAHDIPEGARILALADAWDAMTSERPYSDGLSVHEALTECRRVAGVQFDPVVLAALERLQSAGSALLLERADVVSGSRDASMAAEASARIPRATSVS